MSKNFVLGLDFGGTKIAAGVAEFGTGRLAAYTHKSTPKPGDPGHVLPFVEQMTNELISQAGGEICAIGISFGGPIDKEAKKILFCPHLPGWESFALKEWMEKAFSVPAVIENDANAAAIGENRFGAGRGCRSLLYITVSTGIGSGLILEGKLYKGHDGLAGEIGHMVLKPEGPRCGCGQRGCLEALVSGLAIARRARELLSEPGHEGKLLRSLCGDNLENLSAKTVSEAARRGDTLSRKVLEEAAQNLGWAIANAVNLLNPKRVVLGGSVIKAGDLFIETVRTSAEAFLFPGITLEIVRAELGDLSPLWGAIALAEDLAQNSRT